MLESTPKIKRGRGRPKLSPEEKEEKRLAKLQYLRDYYKKNQAELVKKNTENYMKKYYSEDPTFREKKKAYKRDYYHNHLKPNKLKNSI